MGRRQHGSALGRKAIPRRAAGDGGVIGEGRTERVNLRADTADAACGGAAAGARSEAHEETRHLGARLRMLRVGRGGGGSSVAVTFHRRERQ